MDMSVWTSLTPWQTSQCKTRINKREGEPPGMPHQSQTVFSALTSESIEHSGTGILKKKQQKKKLFLGWRFILALLGRTWYHKYILSQILTILWTHTFWNSYVQLFRNEAHWKKRSPWRFVLSGTLLTQNNIYMYIRLDITFCMRHLQSNGVDSSVKMTWKIGMCTFRLTRSAWENAHIRT